MIAGALAAAAGMTVMAAQITDARAKEIAAEHAGVAQDQILYSKVETDFEKGQLVYEVEFLTKDYKEYDYEISAGDGTVLSYDYEAEGRFYEAIPAQNREIRIDEAKAREIALEHAGKKESEVTFVKAHLDYDDGIAAYEVEFYTADNKEYDYEISAYTGEVLSFDYDIEYYAGQAVRNGGRDAAASGTAITLEQAKEKALAQAGLSASQVRYLNAKQDRDDGRTVYEGSFYYNEMEYEFEIDAATGNVTEWDVESIYD